MTTRVLFLKLTDILLFALHVKANAGVDKLEGKTGYIYTSPREYLWIFMIYQILKTQPSTSDEKTLVRIYFWNWQMMMNTKRYFREKSSKNTSFSYSDLLSEPFKWIKTRMVEDEKKEISILDIRHFNNQLNQEIKNSSMSETDKTYVLKLKNETAKILFTQALDFHKKDFDNQSSDEVFQWYHITYERIAEFFIKILLILLKIPKGDPLWEKCILFGRKISVIGAIHDDMSDIKNDINADGSLREPNLFAVFLDKNQKMELGREFHERFVYTSYEEAREKYPLAYKKFLAQFRKKLKEIPVVTGLNIHELMEYYFFHFPGIFTVNLSNDSRKKGEIKFDGINTFSLHAENISVAEKFRKIINNAKELNRKSLDIMYSGIVSFLFCRELFMSGYGINEISNLMHKPKSTILRWIKNNQYPKSLKNIKNLDGNTIFPDINYLLGIFSVSGNIGEGYLKITSDDKKLLDKLNGILSPFRKIIFSDNNGQYLRYYNKPLSFKLTEMLNNLKHALGSASTSEMEDFITGLTDAKMRKNTFYLSLNKSAILLPFIKKYYSQKNQYLSVQKNGRYMKYSLINKLNKIQSCESRPAEIQSLSKLQQYAKSVILKYFGLQKPEFWDEFPGLFYICFTRSEAKYKEKKENGIDFRQFFKYEILEFFRKYFKENGETKNSISSTDIFENISDEKSGDFENSIDFDKKKISKVMEKLKEKDKDKYLVLALRFGFIDGKEHKLTEDLSGRLFDLGVKTEKNRPLSKSATYRLLQQSLTFVNNYI